MQQEYTPIEYPLSTALEDALCELVIPDSIPQDLYDVCSVLNGLTEQFAFSPIRSSQLRT